MILSDLSCTLCVKKIETCVILNILYSCKSVAIKLQIPQSGMPGLKKKIGYINPHSLQILLRLPT